MTPRLVKQLLYGFFYFLTITIVLWAIYFLFFKPAPTCSDGRRNQGETGIDCGGPCPLCELVQLKPLETKKDRIWSLPARENEISLLAEVANPNLNFGAQRFSYQFKVIGPFGTLLKTIEGQSFIYPGEEKYLIEAAVKISPRDVSRVELIIKKEDLVWQSKEELVKPHLSTRSVKTEITNQEVKVKGLIKNEDPLLISKVKIMAILFDTQSKMLNASFTTMTDLKGLAEEFFSIGLPKGDWTKQLDANLTKIFIEPEPR